ncbi:RDD family protein, partial [Mycolicibacterium madagascariense]|nr:RDD family protein [Mycolicibacterium madagascariense]
LVLAAVLAERHRPELARLQAAPQPPAQAPLPHAPPFTPAPPPTHAPPSAQAPPVAAPGGFIAPD